MDEPIIETIEIKNTKPNDISHHNNHGPKSVSSKINSVCTLTSLCNQNDAKYFLGSPKHL